MPTWYLASLSLYREFPFYLGFGKRSGWAKRVWCLGKPLHFLSSPSAQSGHGLQSWAVRWKRRASRTPHPGCQSSGLSWPRGCCFACLMGKQALLCGGGGCVLPDSFLGPQRPHLSPAQTSRHSPDQASSLLCSVAFLVSCTHSLRLGAADQIEVESRCVHSLIHGSRPLQGLLSSLPLAVNADGMGEGFRIAVLESDRSEFEYWELLHLPVPEFPEL